MIRLAAILALLPAIAAAQEDGRYSTDPACPKMSDGEIALDGTTITFHESSCDLTDPVTVRGLTGAVLYDAVCTGEGETWTRRMMLMPSADGGLVRVEDGFALTYARCEGA